MDRKPLKFHQYISYMMKFVKYTENTYAQQCSLFFILKLDSNHANHICIIMNYNNQYKHINVILNSLNLSLIH